jgi:hypothetical protein
MTTFDPYAYARDIKASPSSYVSLQHVWEDTKALRAIRGARTLTELNAAFQPAARKAKGDTDLLEMFKTAAKKRKEEIAGLSVARSSG